MTDAAIHRQYIEVLVSQELVDYADFERRLRAELDRALMALIVEDWEKKEHEFLYGTGDKQPVGIL